MKLILLNIIILCSMAASSDFYHVINRSYGFIKKANDTLEDQFDYEFMDPVITNEQLEDSEIENDKASVAIMSIDPDGQVNCSIVNNL